MQNYNSKITIKALLILFCALIFLKLTSNSSVFAASINLSNGTPNVITSSDQEYQVNASLSIDNAADGTVYYMRGVFFQTGSTNYCGFTWNGSSWFKGPYTSNDGWKNFLPITISSSSATFSLRAKLDQNDSGCQNNGNYNFKIQRFTVGGSGTFDTQNDQSLTVNIPTPTSTPIPTSVPTSSPTNTPVPTSTSQSSPTVTPVPNSGSVSPTKKPTIAPVVYGDDYDENAKVEAKNSVLGESVSVTTTPTKTLVEQNSKDAKLSFGLLFILIAGGIICIGSAIYLSVKEIRKKEKIFF